MFRDISTSVVQRYKISDRNANVLTLVNTVFVLHFSAFFTAEKHIRILSDFQLFVTPLCYFFLNLQQLSQPLGFRGEPQ